MYKLSFKLLVRSVAHITKIVPPFLWFRGGLCYKHRRIRHGDNLAIARTVVSRLNIAPRHTTPWLGLSNNFQPPITSKANSNRVLILRALHWLLSKNLREVPSLHQSVQVLICEIWRTIWTMKTRAWNEGYPKVPKDFTITEKASCTRGSSGRYFSIRATWVVKFWFFGKNPWGPFIHITWYHLICPKTSKGAPFRGF